MQPKVTVIIVNWNGERFLHRCLSALQEQTAPPKEIILVDNASSDRSLDIAKSFPAVKTLAQKQNIGFASANNLAIKTAAADSDWIALINPDAFPEKTWLEALLLAAESHTDFDFFASKLLNASDLSILDGVGDAYHVSGLVWRIGHGLQASNSADQEQEIFSPCAAAALYKRSVFSEVGGFDEDYFCYVEDVDLGFRLRLAGHRCLYVPTSIALHVGSGTSGGQRSDFAIYYGHRNVVWTYIKNMPGILFWMFLPLHLAMNLAVLIIFTVRGHGRIIIQAKKDALIGLPLMWKKRKVAQSLRTVPIRSIHALMKMKVW